MIGDFIMGVIYQLRCEKCDYKFEICAGYVGFCHWGITNKNKDKYGDQVGKLDFNLEKALKYEDAVLKKSYHNVKNLGTTVATIGAGILASNIITPILRNKMASNVQKSIIGNRKEVEKPKVETVPAPQVVSPKNNGPMRI